MATAVANQQKIRQKMPFAMPGLVQRAQTAVNKGARPFVGQQQPAWQRATSGSGVPSGDRGMRLQPTAQAGAFNVGGRWYFQNGEGNIVPMTGQPTIHTRRIGVPSHFQAPVAGGTPRAPAAPAAPGVQAPIDQGGAPTAPAPNTPVNPATNPFDLQYMIDSSNAQLALGNQLAPLQSQLNALQTKDPHGLTMYDRLYQNLTSDTQQQRRSEENSLGLGYFSSQRDTDMTNIAKQYESAQSGLDTQYGAGAISGLQTQIGQQNQLYQSQLANLVLAAQQRMSQQDATVGPDDTAAGYNPLAPPAAPAPVPGAPAGRYVAGAFQKGGKWYFQNVQGNVAPYPGKPPSHTRIITAPKGR